jgi:chromate transporter
VFLSRQVFENRAMVVLAVASFLGMYVFDMPFPVIILAAGVIGYLGYRWAPDVFIVMTGHDADADEAVISDVPALQRSRRNDRH